MAAQQEIRITFRRVALESVTLTHDDARAIFGLGGTPDHDLPGSLADLLAARPFERIMRLLRTVGVDVELDRDLSVELTGLADPADGQQFYPVPPGHPGRQADPSQPGPPERRSPASPEGRVAGPEGHVCLSCGCQIAEGLREVPVPGRRRGVRYMHADSGDCADALRAPQPNKALIGRYKAPPEFRWNPARPSARDRGTGPAGRASRPGGPAASPRRGRAAADGSASNA